MFSIGQFLLLRPSIETRIDLLRLVCRRPTRLLLVVTLSPKEKDITGLGLGLNLQSFIDDASTILLI